MEHFITQIHIKELFHLRDITINLDETNRQHLLITGKNGSGKTTLLLAIQRFLRAVNAGKLNRLSEYERVIETFQSNIKNAQSAGERYNAEQNRKSVEDTLRQYKDGIELSISGADELDELYQKGDFITAFSPANRRTNVIPANGVEDIKLDEAYDIDSEPSEILLKYMVHLKTQQSYARNEGEIDTADRIQEWFDRFEGALRVLLDDDTIRLEYDYKRYDFLIIEKGKEPFNFGQLSDGYSSVIHIVSDLILRMDKNWLLKDRLSQYDVEGIVLIDELETHLHIDLQKKILPFLVDFFPRIQFIVTTHSPYILNSVSNAKAYDLESQAELSNLSMFSSEQLVEGYFDTDGYSERLKKRMAMYQDLLSKDNLSEQERAERAALRIEFKNLPVDLEVELSDKFAEIERKRNAYDKN